MLDRSFAVLLIAGFAAAAPFGAQAQSPQVPPLQDRWPAPAQQLHQVTPAAPLGTRAPAAPSPFPAQPPALSAVPGAAPPAAAPSINSTVEPSRPVPLPRSRTSAIRAREKPAARSSARSFDCSGVFARNSSHAALVRAFNSDNVTFGEVTGSSGRKHKASVLFPNDPRRRLEVLWYDDEQRRDIRLIVIKQRSTWTGPMGLRLGLSLLAVEQMNGTPFVLQGFDRGGGVTDWQHGALDSVPGGCVAGISFSAPPATPKARVTEAFGYELMSNDQVMRAVKPTVSEILIAYPDPKDAKSGMRR